MVAFTTVSAGLSMPQPVGAQPPKSQHQGVRMSGPAAFFIANDGQGSQLWVTDGTAAGTVALETAPPEVGSLIDVGGIAYFAVASSTYGQPAALWRSDGTSAGTFALGAIADPNGQPPAVAQLGSAVYFFGNDGANGEALFASTDGGTPQRVLDVNSNPNSNAPDKFLGVVDSHLWMDIGNTLWVTDGTASGTKPLSDGEASPDLTSPQAPIVLNGKTYVSAVDSDGTATLWMTDGTSVTPINNPSVVDGGGGGAVLAGDRLVFVTGNQTSTPPILAWDGLSASSTTISNLGLVAVLHPVLGGNGLSFEGFDPARGSGISYTDGTPAGTFEIMNDVTDSFNASKVVAVGAGLVFAGGNEVFVVGPGNSNPAVAAFAVIDPIRVGSVALFATSEALWVTNGTVAGTRIIASNLTIGSSSATVMNGELLFQAAPDGKDFEPWVSDGTAAGTHLLVQLHPTAPGHLTLNDGVVFDGELLLNASTPTRLGDRWVSDGTAAGTSDLGVFSPEFTATVTAGGDLYLVGGANILEVITSPSAAPLEVGAGFSSPQFMTALNGDLLFYQSGQGLVSASGTSASVISADTVLAQPVVLGSKLLFAGSSAASGEGLYTSDGTSGGTSFLVALPSAVPPQEFTVSSSQAFFVAGSTATGPELWVTDGTVAGTHLVEDIAAGLNGSDIANLSAFDGGVVFTANDGVDGNQVWFSNGTVGGTFELRVNPTENTSVSIEAGAPVSFDGKTYFLADDGTHGEALWLTDGTSAGTNPVVELMANPGQESGSSFTVVNNQLFFVDQGEAWVTQGTSGSTVMISPTGAAVLGAASLGGSLYFVTSPHGFFSGNNGTIFVTDGTAAGTHQVLSGVGSQPFGALGNELIFFGANQSNVGLFSCDVTTQQQTFLGNVSNISQVLFSSAGQLQAGFGFGGPDIWVTDGTAAGTTLLLHTSNGSFEDFTALNGKVFFESANQFDTADQGVWVTDGTAAGTQHIVNVATAPGLTAFGGEIYFEQQVISGTVTFALKALDPSDDAVSQIATDAEGAFGLTVAGANAYFVADDATSQNELWRLNGSGAPIELTTAANGQIGSSPFAVAAMGGGLFFAADDTTHGESLFFTDGSTATFITSVTLPSDFSVIGGSLYFQQDTPTDGNEVWVSDGTAAGTHMLTDTETPNSANASGFVSAGGKMFFSATDGVHGQELWVFNGQVGGAVMVADIAPGSAGSNPTDLTALGQDVVFLANSGAGAELWRSDGTAAGTFALTSATNGGDPQDLTEVGSDVFFFGADSTHGSGLFVSDGTAVGTTFVASFSAASQFIAGSGRVYFQGTTAEGTELWTSDGTAAGTTQLSNTTTNPGSNPVDFTTRAGASTEPAHDNFNGDGVSDFLIQNTVGAVVTGETQLGQPNYTALTGLGPEWRFVATGDFLGLGDDQFIIENTTGVVDVASAGHGHETFTQVAALGPEWSFRGAGDFTGAGHDQFLIENTSGAVVIGDAMNGLAAYAQVAALGPEWSFRGAGDLLGDGKDQFLIQNTAGAVVIGEVTSGSAAYTSVVGLGPEWTFVGTGDFLGEGHDQFLIENTSGAVDIGDYTGGAIHFTNVVGLGSEWKFVGAGDYLDEGHDQFLIENSSGAVVVGDYTAGAIHFTQVAALGPEWAFH
jgi:ELWxxDGT repeat protein